MRALLGDGYIARLSVCSVSVRSASISIWRIGISISSSSETRKIQKFGKDTATRVMTDDYDGVYEDGSGRVWKECKDCMGWLGWWIWVQRPDIGWKEISEEERHSGISANGWIWEWVTRRCLCFLFLVSKKSILGFRVYLYGSLASGSWVHGFLFAFVLGLDFWLWVLLARKRMTSMKE